MDLLRQRDLVPHSKMANTNFVVIGVGAIGRQVAILLAASGASNVTIFDNDKVSKENLGVQGYGPDDLDRYKVHVVSDVMTRLNPDTFVAPEPRAVGKDAYKIVWQSAYKERNVVFCCVDSITAREDIFDCLLVEGFAGNAEGNRPGLFIDGRMAAETLRVVTWPTSEQPERYQSTLFPSGESFKAPCTGRTTLYSSYVVAGLMMGECVKWLRDELPTTDQTFNLRASEHWCH